MLKMKLMFEIPTYKASPVVIEALNKLFILHADHEQNCSTSTVRMVGLFSCRFIRVNIFRSMWDPTRRSNQVLEMLEEIHRGMLINIWQKPKIKTILLD
jgi:citrate synthase